MFKCCHATKAIVLSLPNYCCRNRDTFSASSFLVLFFLYYSVTLDEMFSAFILCYELLVMSISLAN